MKFTNSNFGQKINRPQTVKKREQSSRRSLFAYKIRLNYLPIFILIGRTLHTVFLQFCDHTVKLALPKPFKPICMSKPFYKSWADCVIRMNKCPTVPSRAQSVIAIAAECPHLRAIIRAVNAVVYEQPKLAFDST